MKLTKIIATLGPSCESEKEIEKLILKGVNIFRFNFKHNDTAWHESMIQRVQKISVRLNMPIGTLIDLAGPEIRINLTSDILKIEEDKLYSFGPGRQISITHPEIYKYIHEGQKIVVDDGRFRFTLEKRDKGLYLRAHSEGVLKNKKSLSIPGSDFPVNLLVDRDLEGLMIAAKYKIDFIALSFVRNHQDIFFLRQEMKKMNVASRIVAKIETQKAVQNLERIIKEADIVMVARGDLGVEFPLEHVPYYQKKIIKKCLEYGVPVITATQMLESMIELPYPTRAEISDVANAAYDFTDAVMLSAETAIGKYPSKAVATMNRAVSFSEKMTEEDVRLRHKYNVENQTELICDAAYNLYFQHKKTSKITGFIVLTQTGKTASTLSRYRPHVPIYTFTPTKQVACALSVNFGIYSFVLPSDYEKKTEVRREDIKQSISFLKEHTFLKEKEQIIALYGDIWGVKGGTTTIRLVTI